MSKNGTSIALLFLSFLMSHGGDLNFVFGPETVIISIGVIKYDEYKNLESCV